MKTKSYGHFEWRLARPTFFQKIKKMPFLSQKCHFWEDWSPKTYIFGQIGLVLMSIQIFERNRQKLPSFWEIFFFSFKIAKKLPEKVNSFHIHLEKDFLGKRIFPLRSKHVLVKKKYHFYKMFQNLARKTVHLFFP